jgi:hypothetical protein
VSVAGPISSGSQPALRFGGQNEEHGLTPPLTRLVRRRAAVLHEWRVPAEAHAMDFSIGPVVLVIGATLLLFIGLAIPARQTQKREKR